MGPSAPPPAGPNLPAPYISPWRLLGRDLLAIAASLGLKRRELWRLNASGQLPRPGFWPAELAALFWPLLVSLLILMTGAGLGLGLGWWGVTSTTGPIPPLERAGPSGLVSGPVSRADAAPAGHEAAGEAGFSTAQEAPRSPEAAADDGPAELKSDLQPPPGSPAAGAAHPPDETPTEAALPPASFPVGVDQDALAGAERQEQPLDPAPTLLQLLRARTPTAPPLAASPDPAGAGLLLRVGPAFAAATPQQRQSWADAWLDLARQQGYQELSLEDRAGRPLGRQARVGSGMILLQPFSESR